MGHSRFASLTLLRRRLGQWVRSTGSAGSRWRRTWLALAALLVVAIGSESLPAQQTRRPAWPWEHAAGPFLFHADFKLGEQRATAIQREIAELSDDLGKATGLHVPGERIYFFFFASEHNYRRYVKRWFPDAPARPALFVKGQGPGMVFAVAGKDFGEDLRHETTHALLHSTLPVAPLWLDEGLAEYFERPPAQRFKGHDHLRRLRFDLFLHQTTPLTRLEGLRRAHDMGEREYRYAWAWTHLLLHGPAPVRAVLPQFLNDLRLQRPWFRFRNGYRPTIGISMRSSANIGSASINRLDSVTANAWVAID
jgi:hypothetical protein